MTPSPTKGATTREAILARSYALACVNGLEGLTIGAVADYFVRFYEQTRRR